LAARLVKILVPVNFLPESASALRYARIFGRRFDATITLLHVVEPIVRAADYGYGTVTTCCPNPHLVKNAEARLRTLARRRPHSGASWRVLIRTGIAEAEILGAAREMDADLIVMGGPENRSSSQSAIDSTTVRVVRQARCPVFVAHEKEFAVNGVRKVKEKYEIK
jgi:nucleotide-binding universal stress UspA family protein